jgi:hypothetical protein
VKLVMVNSVLGRADLRGVTAVFHKVRGQRVMWAVQKRGESGRTEALFCHT